MHRACAPREGLLVAESNPSGGTLGDSHAAVIVSSTTESPQTRQAGIPALGSSMGAL